MNYELKPSYWEQLAERYFQAETTEAEEQQLRRFLCSSQAQDPRFDEIRATMSLLHVSRQASLDPSRGVKKTPSPLETVGVRLRLQIVAVAACLCIAMFLGWRQYQQHNISSVRIAGVAIEADASQLMQQQMTEMLNPTNPGDR
jgi:hypothetical protein